MDTEIVEIRYCLDVLIKKKYCVPQKLCNSFEEFVFIAKNIKTDLFRLSRLLAFLNFTCTKKYPIGLTHHNGNTQTNISIYVKTQNAKTKIVFVTDSTKICSKQTDPMKNESSTSDRCERFK